MSNIFCGNTITDSGSWGVSVTGGTFYSSFEFVFCPVLEQYFSKVVCEKLCRKRKCANKDV